MESTIKCRKCKKLEIVKDGAINPELVFHMYDTHGLPMEMTIKKISKIIKEDMKTLNHDGGGYKRIKETLNKGEKKT